MKIDKTILMITDFKGGYSLKAWTGPYKTIFVPFNRDVFWPEPKKWYQKFGNKIKMLWQAMKNKNVTVISMHDMTLQLNYSNRDPKIQMHIHKLLAEANKDDLKFQKELIEPNFYDYKLN